MATSITITYDDKTVTVHVTDSTGRDQTASSPRYGTPGHNAGTDQYVRFVDALDVYVYENDDARICDHVAPRCGAPTRGNGPGYCGEVEKPAPAPAAGPTYWRDNLHVMVDGKRVDLPADHPDRRER
jgi:hypothetical protein